MDEKLQVLIQQSQFLGPGDKSFLLSRLDQISPLEKLRLQQSLHAKQAPAILQNLNLMRAKFFESEKSKQPDPITKVVERFIPKKPKPIVSTSILSKPQILGAPIPQTVPARGVAPLTNILEISHPAQLSQLQPQHITFSISDNIEQILSQFLQRLTDIFNRIEDVHIRRNYFMNFLQSQLFRSYLNSGITALKHTELRPRKISLNLLFQIDSRYLNNRQFQHASLICNHLRTLCAL